MAPKKPPRGKKLSSVKLGNDVFSGEKRKLVRNNELMPDYSTRALVTSGAARATRRAGALHRARRGLTFTPSRALRAVGDTVCLLAPGDDVPPFVAQ